MRKIGVILHAIALAAATMSHHTHLATKSSRKLSVALTNISSKKAKKDFGHKQKKKAGNFRSKLNSKPNSVRKDFNQRRR